MQGYFQVGYRRHCQGEEMNDEQIESIQYAAEWLSRSEDLSNRKHAERLRALLADGGKGEAVGQWVHCSPALLNAGVSCAHTPRRACECSPANGGHDHFIAHTAPQAEDAPRKYDPATQWGDPNFDGAEAYEAHLEAECAPREAALYDPLLGGVANSANAAWRAPREAQPVCWITREQLERVEDEGEDVWVYWAETGHVAEPDEVALYAAPQAECAPREAQPVGPRTTLNYDGTFDTTCAHCGGNGCFACLKSAAPTPERADAERKYTAAEMEQYGKAYADARDKRADAGKDAALTDEQIIEIFQDHYTEEPGDAEPGHILPFARAILAADKEPK
jgi:hypothetical protein